MRRKKVSLPWERLLPAALFAVIFAFCFFSPTSPLHTQTVQAQSSGTNYAWSETIGWISFDCANEGVCSASNYKISEGAGGVLSGYAWSENIGWISFNAADVSGCPSGTCSPSVNLSTGAVSGWARACGSFDDKSICSGSQSKAGGWEGWIHLSGAGYGTTQTAGDCTWTGWAWGGGNIAGNAVIGWIHLNGSGYQVSVEDSGSNCGDGPLSGDPPTVTLTADPNPTPYVPNNQTILTWGSTNAVSCGDIIYTDGGGTQRQISTGGATSGVTSSVTVPPPTTRFTLTCTNSHGTGNGQVDVIVPSEPTGGCTIDSFTADPKKVRKGATSNLTWETTSCSECSITNVPDSSTFPYTVPVADVVSGSKGTDAIQVATTFTLSCDGGDAVSDVTVGIRPIIIEQ